MRGDDYRMKMAAAGEYGVAPGEDVITLVRDGGHWQAVYSGPHAAKTEELFGTVCLPTPFAATWPAERVRQILQSRHYDVTVQVQVDAAAARS